MKILLAEKVSNYINSLSIDKSSLIINKLNILKNKSKTEITKLKGIVSLSQNEAINFFGYYIFNSTYAVFAFSKGKLIIVDLIELKDNKISSLILKSEIIIDESTAKD